MPAKGLPFGPRSGLSSSHSLGRPSRYGLKRPFAYWNCINVFAFGELGIKSHRRLYKKKDRHPAGSDPFFHAGEGT